jgi:HEAT repeat protein
VLSELTRQIAALPAKPDYNQKRLIEELMGAPSNCDFHKGMLRPVRKALAPYALSALRAKDPAPQRHVFVWVLAESKRAEAVEGLALALGDASKAVREMARKALTARGPDATLAALGEALASKRKDTRAEAVSVLSAFAPHAGVRALAAERAGKEKDAKVRAALKALAAKKGRPG